MWMREADSNHRPSGYEPDELPAAPSREHNTYMFFTSGCQTISLYEHRISIS